MARLSRTQLKKVQDKLGCDKLWSWSRYNNYKTSQFEYLLQYVQRAKQTRQSIYGDSGGLIHDIIEDFYSDKIKFDDMLPIYEEGLSNFNDQGLKYNRGDDDKNRKTADKYEECIRHFLSNHNIIDSKLELEKFITVKLSDNHYCQGYIDAIYKNDEGKVCVTDWKSSSIYSGKKIDQEKGQLLLYGLGIHQMGVPIEDILLQWNFLKYMNISFMQKNGKIRTTRAERHSWVDKIHNRLSMDLRDCEWDELDIQLEIAECVDNNSIESLPQEVQDKYTFEDCYVEAPFTQVEVDILVKEMIRTFDEIDEKTEEYNKTKDDKLFWDDSDHVKKQSYYFANLCSFSPHQHKPYKQYLEENQLFKNDNEKKDYSRTETVEEDNSWLAELGL